MRAGNRSRVIEVVLVGVLVVFGTSVSADESRQQSPASSESGAVRGNDRIGATQNKKNRPSGSQDQDIGRKSRDVQRPKAEQRPGAAKAKSQDPPRRELKAEQRSGRPIEKGARKREADEEARQRPGKHVNKGGVANQD